MDTLGFEPRAFRVRSGCDATTPCATCRWLGGAGTINLCIPHLQQLAFATGVASMSDVREALTHGLELR